MGDSSGSMFYGVIGFLVVYFVGYFICVYDKIKKILRSHSSKSQRREDDNV